MKIKIQDIYPVLENNLFGGNSHATRVTVEFPNQHKADMSVICDTNGNIYGFREEGQDVGYIPSNDIRLTKVDVGDSIEVDEVSMPSKNNETYTFTKSKPD